MERRKQIWPLAAKSPKFYRCPQGEDPASDTNYLAVVGQETLWPGSESLAFLDILDGSSNTIAIVESHQTGIKWTEPRDLTFSNMDWQINGTMQLGKISSLHPGGAMAAMADGSTQFIPQTIDQDVLRALTTAQGGEPIAAILGSDVSARRASLGRNKSSQFRHETNADECRNGAEPCSGLLLRLLDGRYEIFRQSLKHLSRYMSGDDGWRLARGACIAAETQLGRVLRRVRSSVFRRRPSVEDSTAFGQYKLRRQLRSG